MSEFELSERSSGLLTDFVSDLTWGELTPKVQDAAKLCLLDALGAMLVGTLTPVAHIAADYALKTWRGTEATVYARGKRSSAVGAAFANGAAANGTDIDDCGIYTWGHPGAQLVPTALALSEEQGCSGRELLESLVIGYEIAFRAARCSHDYHETYRACGSWGSVACAGLSARLTGLPAKLTMQALGIADYNAPFLPMMRDIDCPTMVKHGIGLGAHTGIMSAQLAARGFTAPPPLIGFERYENWISDLGSRYLIDGGITWKEHSCCAWTHPALLAVKRLREAHDIPLDRVTHIHVETYEEACRLHVQQPETTEEAQFSLPWTVAVMLLDDEVGPRQVLESRLRDPIVRGLATKVASRPSDELTRLHALIEDFDPAGKDAAVLRIELEDGTVLDSGLVDLPVRPLSREELEAKFRRVTERVLEERDRNEVIDLVHSLDREPGIASLVEALLARTEASQLSGGESIG